MYRLFVLVCLISVAAAESQWPWQRQKSELSAKTAAGAVNEIKRLLIDVERKMQRFCRKYTDRPLEERHGSKYYSLRANLTGCSESGVEVRAGQRLVSVQARDGCDYIALRLLPTTVDANSAFWLFEKGQLTILFSYETDNKHCGRVISDAIHTLPKFETLEDYSDADDLGNPDRKHS